MTTAIHEPITHAALEIVPVAGRIGAEIRGIKLSADLDPRTAAAVKTALHRHKVIFFRDQDITPHQHLAFAKRFGEVVEYPMVKGLDEVPEIVPVVKLAHETTNFGGMWHSDTSYLECPPMGAILVARELPPYGGDTMFANMALAYERLSDGKRQANVLPEKARLRFRGAALMVKVDARLPDGSDLAQTLQGLELLDVVRGCFGAVVWMDAGRSVYPAGKTTGEFHAAL